MKSAVIGAGTMGHGIAQLLATAGDEVWLSDIAEPILSSAVERMRWSLGKLAERGKLRESPEAVLSRIHTTTDMDMALLGASFVVEAVVEDLSVKADVFSRADSLADESAVLATNTSSLPISEIARATRRPERVIGMHFFNPPQLMPLVEIVLGERTSERSLEYIKRRASDIGKEHVVVRKDVPGFIVNRVLVRMLNTACVVYERGVAGMGDIDLALRQRAGFPMGMFELADYSGIDVFYLIMKAMKERGFVVSPCRSIEEKYRARELGMKTGKGFYQYREAGKYERASLPQGTSSFDEALVIAPAVNEAAWLVREGVSSFGDVDKATRLGLGLKEGVVTLGNRLGALRVLSALQELSGLTGLPEYEPDPLLLQLAREGKPLA